MHFCLVTCLEVTISLSLFNVCVCVCPCVHTWRSGSTLHAFLYCLPLFLLNLAIFFFCLAALPVTPGSSCLSLPPGSPSTAGLVGLLVSLAFMWVLRIQTQILVISQLYPQCLFIVCFIETWSDRVSLAILELVI